MSFESTMEFVFKWEGGYTNNPADPGGETNYGISKRAHPDVDIKNLTKEAAIEIYKNEYWIPAGCESMADADALVMMDTAVNMGVGRAKQFLGESTGWKEFILIRIKYYISLRNKYPQFIFGWLNRVMDLFDYARES
jgi:lysozyme family protein